MTEPIWLNREDCLAIHDLMLSQHGGLAGIRDEALLESALAKPRHLRAYEHRRWRKWPRAMRRGSF